MKRFQKTLWVLLLLVSQVAFSQDDSTEKQQPKFKLGINYNSSLNYFGRTDSLRSTGFFPLAELWLTKDLYINAAPIFVNNAVQSMEYALKPFYKQSSQLVQSALKAQTGASFSKLSRLINITAGADLKFSDKTDIGATAGIDHLIRKQFANNDVLVINPSAYVYAGTQNFTNTYNKNRPGFLLIPGSQQQVNENVTTFNVLAYEFSVPVVYAKGKWMALLTPAYIIPQNLLTVENRPDLSERGQNLLYATLGLKYSF